MTKTKQWYEDTNNEGVYHYFNQSERCDFEADFDTTLRLASQEEANVLSYKNQYDKNAEQANKDGHGDATYWKNRVNELR